MNKNFLFFILGGILTLAVFLLGSYWQKANTSSTKKSVTVQKTQPTVDTVKILPTTKAEVKNTSSISIKSSKIKKIEEKKPRTSKKEEDIEKEEIKKGVMDELNKQLQPQ